MSTTTRVGDLVEGGRPVSEVGDDERRRRATQVVEPEQLVEVVGRARHAPPPLQLGRLVRTMGRVGVADALQQRRNGIHIVEAASEFLTHRAKLVAGHLRLPAITKRGR
jgi:hypothetical protein